MSKSQYIDEFKNRILGQAFTFAGKPYFCNDARRQSEKLVVTTKQRTFVFLHSQLEDITILQPTSKTTETRKLKTSNLQQRKIKIHKDNKHQELAKKVNEAFNNRREVVQILEKKQKRQISNVSLVELTEDKKKELFDKYFDKNFTSNFSYFTKEEDELLLKHSSEVLSAILGRTSSSLNVRRFTIKKKMKAGETLDEIHSKKHPLVKKSKFDPKFDYLILERSNAELLKMFPEFKASQLSARRQYLKTKNQPIEV